MKAWPALEQTCVTMCTHKHRQEIADELYTGAGVHRRLDKVMHTKYQIVELAKEPIDLL